MRPGMIATFLLTIASVLSAQDEQSLAQNDFFERRIRPVLVEHCYECHSADSKQLRGGLLVDRPSGLAAGGDSGPAVVPGNVAESLLIDALKHESFEMPPSGKLPPEVVADFVTWIEQGAHDPRPDEPFKKPAQHTIDLAEGRKFWAFQPPQMKSVPDVKQQDWPSEDIDRYLLASQEAAGLAPGTDASRMELLRRLSFDLIGLPPSPEEIREFLADQSPNAVETVVDRLLASSHFGERWGRHWLDVARYADSTGGGRSMLYGESWYYRNYVIQSFNADKPFDQFLVEQIAGDLLSSDDLDTRRAQLIATGFLALGPTNYELQDKKQLRMDVVDEQIETIGKTFLAMTLGCARCHDHKFDPIPQTDYYALAGILRNTQTLIDDNVSTWVKRPYPLDEARQAEADQYAALIADQKKLVEQLKGQKKAPQEKPLNLPGTLVDDDQAELFDEWTESTSVKTFLGRGYRHAQSSDARAVFTANLKPGEYNVFLGTTFAPNRCPNTLVIVDHGGGQQEIRADQQNPSGIQGFVPLGKFRFESTARVTISGTGKANGVMIADGVLFSPVEDTPPSPAQPEAVADATSQDLETQIKEAEAKLKQLEKDAPKIPQLISVQDMESIVDCPLHIRGSISNLGDPVPRGFVSVMTNEPLPEFPPSASGRLQLAEWLASSKNPLTARVYVNRIWSKLFGQGLVRTVDNFGAPGERPSHPELLDRLALDFMSDGWSTKRFVRRLVLTHAYQLTAEAARTDADPDNRLLCHQNFRRLDAECLYDALLSVSGELQSDEVDNAVRSGTSSEYGYEFEIGPRAVFLPMFRNQLPDLFAVFDFPNPNLPAGRRNVSTLSTQALFLLNSPFVQQRSAKTADRLLSTEGDDPARVETLYLLTLSRTPSPTESRLILDYLDRETALGTTRSEAWSRAVQSVIGSLDFRYR